MDRLTLTLYAEQQPERAMKRPAAGNTWSGLLWCADCARRARDGSEFTVASADDYPGFNYCICCRVLLEFTDGPSHAGAAG